MITETKRGRGRPSRANGANALSSQANKECNLPFIYTNSLCDVFDDELYRTGGVVDSREKAFRLVKANMKLVYFYLPLAYSRRTRSIHGECRF